jgi:DNA-binding FrmR family transcriptional regulator
MHSKQSDVLTNFKKAHSLTQRLIKMSDEGKYCIDIMQQNLAAIGLLRVAHQKLMEDHLNHCFKEAMETGSSAKKKKMISEILSVMKLNNRS